MRISWLAGPAGHILSRPSSAFAARYSTNVVTPVATHFVWLLEDDGWRHVRTRGSHRKYVHPRKPGHVIVPGRPGDDVALGTLLSVLKKAGLQ